MGEVIDPDKLKLYSFLVFSKLELGNAVAISSTAPPAPQPTSTTRAPDVNRPTTPSSVGSTTGTRKALFQGSKLR